MREDMVKPFLPVFSLFEVAAGLDPLEDGLEDDLLLAVVDLQVVVGDQVDQLVLANRDELVAVDNLKMKKIEVH
jgi:hypothetical protein